jgi:DNA adenine methylase
VATDLRRRGARVVVSNADHPSIVRLYKAFKLRKVERASLISASGRFRRRITECVFFNED